MISAFFDVLRPALSLAFFFAAVFALKFFIEWNSRRMFDHQAKRLFVGNRKPRPGRPRHFI